jgi:hypothetical protein
MADCGPEPHALVSGMGLYSVYVALGEGRRTACVYSFTARDDVAAEKFVAERLTSRPVELWYHSRRVAQFDGKRLT